MNVNLKILLACIVTLSSGVIVNAVVNNIKETNELIKRGETLRETTKEIEEMFAKDQEDFNQLLKKNES